MTPAYELVRPNWTWQGKLPSWWESWMDSIWSRSGFSGQLRHPEVQQRHIVSGYSLGDPFEWMSDNQIAYVFTELEKQYFKNNSITDEASRKNTQEKIASQVSVDWPSFLHLNFDGAPYYEVFKKRYPILVKDKQIMAQRYIKPIIEGGFGLTDTKNLAPHGKPGHRCSRHRK